MLHLLNQMLRLVQQRPPQLLLRLLLPKLDTLHHSHIQRRHQRPGTLHSPLHPINRNTLQPRICRIQLRKTQQLPKRAKILLLIRRRLIHRPALLLHLRLACIKLSAHLPIVASLKRALLILLPRHRTLPYHRVIRHSPIPKNLLRLLPIRIPLRILTPRVPVIDRYHLNIIRIKNNVVIRLILLIPRHTIRILHTPYPVRIQPLTRQPPRIHPLLIRLILIALVNTVNQIIVNTLPAINTLLARRAKLLTYRRQQLRVHLPNIRRILIPMQQIPIIHIRPHPIIHRILLALLNKHIILQQIIRNKQHLFLLIQLTFCKLLHRFAL